MEEFDFDTLTDRRGTSALKWDAMTEAEQRDGIVPLSVADMEFKSAPCIQRALIDAARHGLYGYTGTDDAYVNALKGWMKRRHDLDFAKEELSIVGGVVPGLALSVRAFTQPGEGVIVQPPVYPPFMSVVELNGRKLMKNPLVREADGSYHIDFAQLERLAADPSAKLMLFCSPHNPVGRVWTEDELKTVWEICAANGVTLVTDEIHADLTHGKRHIP
ncbi:MAG: aminotransferase class I/II-fold pyridoxal phosphate-dependent enzyme, partial [Clostridia bacterium]|nr:aminotransferase class I/II-fold pyridoxal phosphate-dependent enzyme [Clostridia bacterium]